MDNYKISLSALLDANAKGDINKQLDAIKDLSITISKANLDQSAINDIKRQLAQNGIDLNLVFGNIGQITNQTKQVGQQIGQQIGQQVSQGITNGVSKAKVDKIQLSWGDGSYEAKYDSLIAKTKQWVDANNESVISTQNLAKAYNDFNVAASNFTLDSSDVNRQKLIDTEKELSIQIKTTTNEIKKQNAEYAKTSKIDSLHQKVQEFYDKNTATHKKWGKQLKSMLDETAHGAQLTATRVNEIEQEFLEVGNAARQAGKLGDSFFGGIAKQASKFLQWVSITSVIMEGVQQIKKMINEVKELDKAMTDLSMATGYNRTQVKELMKTYFELGDQLSATATDVAESAGTWLRQGMSIAETNELIKDSMILSKIGGISAEESTKYLTSAMKGYKVAAEDVLGVVDKLSAVDMASATDVGGLAQGMSEVASSAKLAGVSMDKLLGYLASIGEVTQSGMSEVGTTLNAIFARMGNIKLSRLKDFETGEDLSNVETVLRGVGISLRDSTNSFRDFDEVLDETASRWDSFSEVQQRAIAQAFSGTHHLNEFLILMDNYDTALKYTETSLKSTGQAMEKFSAYEESIAGSTERFNNAFQDLSETIVNSDLLMGIVDLGTTTIKIIDSIIESIGLLGTAFGGAGIFALTKIKDIKEIFLGTKLFNTISDLIYTQEVLAAINGVQLTSWQKLKIGISYATKAMLKWLATNPVAWAVGLTAALGGLIKVYDKVIGKQEELARTKLTELNNDITEYEEEIRSLEELQSKLQDAKGDKAELAKIQGELNKVIGETAGLINGEGEAYEIANAKLKAHIDLKKQQLKYAQQQKIEQSKSIFNNNTLEKDWDFDITGEQMRQVAEQYQKNIANYNSFTDKAKEDIEKLFNIDNAVDYANHMLKESKIDLGYGFVRTVNIDESIWSEYWNDQVATAYDIFAETINSYDGFGGQELLTNIVNDMVRSGSDLSEINNALIDVIDNNNIQDAVDKYWESLFDPNIDSEKALSEVKAIFDNITGKYPELASVFEGLFNEIATGIEDVNNAVANLETPELSFEEQLSQIESLSEGFDQLADIYEDVKNKGTFDFSSIFNNDDFKEAFRDVGEEYEEFLKVIASSPDDIEACQQAFNNLATAYVESTGYLNILTAENKNYIITLLEQKGIANATAIVENKLAEIEAKAFLKKIDLANATQIAYKELLKEAEAAGIAKDKLYELMLQEVAYSENTSFETKLEQIHAIAEAYGDVATMALAASMLDDPSFDPYKHGGGYNALESIILSAKEAIKKNTEDNVIEYKPITLNPTKASSTSTKETKQDIDWIARKLEVLKKGLDAIKKKASEVYSTFKKQNKYIDDAIKNINDQMATYNKAYDNYMKKANSLGLDKKYIDLIKNGGMNVSTYSGDLADKIQEYQKWYDKAQDVKKTIDELKEEQKELSLQKFDNIVDDYDKKTAYIESLIELRKAEAGGEDNLKEKDYNYIIKKTNNLIYKSNKEVELLEEQLNNLVQKGYIKKHDDEWYELKEKIAEAKVEAEQYVETLEELNNAYIDGLWAKFDRGMTKLDKFQEDLNNIKSFFDGDLFDGTELTDDGLVHLTTAFQGMASAQQEIENYTHAIADLKRQYDNGAWAGREEEYADKLDALTSAAKQASLQLKEYRDVVINIAIEGIEAERNAVNDLIDAKKEELQKEKD